MARWWIYAKGLLGLVACCQAAEEVNACNRSLQTLPRLFDQMLRSCPRRAARQQDTFEDLLSRRQQVDVHISLSYPQEYSVEELTEWAKKEGLGFRFQSGLEEIVRLGVDGLEETALLREGEDSVKGFQEIQYWPMLMRGSVQRWRDSYAVVGWGGA
eukprot:s3820_g3.t1